jgi:hypothetical protein
MNPPTPDELTLDLLDGQYAISRLGPDQPVPAWAWYGSLASVTRTPDELSIVCAEAAVPEHVERVERVERGWRALRVADPLDFGMVGVMARLTVPLAEVGISVLALATFDTDYLLVRETDLARAVAALRAAEHRVIQTP